MIAWREDLSADSSDLVFLNVALIVGHPIDSRPSNPLTGPVDVV
jgi:hypothetical protein